MSFFKPDALSPKQIERRKRIQAKGRKHFIFYRGILGWGMPVFVATTLWDWYYKMGWHIATRGKVYSFILIRLAIWSVAGYFWGAFMWKRFFDAPTPGASVNS